MGALSGLRVVEVSAFVAAPLAGATLASLGAEVIRVEQRGGGIDAKRWPLHEGRSLYRAGLDRGTRSVALDLRTSRGRELAAALVTAPGENAGIFVTNLGGRGWASYDQLAAARPDLVMILLGGTPDGRAAVDYTVNAGAGFPLVTGPADSERPVNHVLPAWDVAAGLLAAVGILSAERHRRLTGKGQLVELALSDVALAIADHLGFLAEARLIAEPRPRLGNDLYGTYARDFRTCDGRDVIVVALTSRQWISLGEATALEAAFAAIEARHRVDLRDEGARFTHRDEISALLAHWVGQRTLAQVAAAFDANDVLWGPYRTFKELLRDNPGAASAPTSALRFSAAQTETPPSAPQIGADTERVLRDVLGIDSNEVDTLRSDGIID
jgi:2-methylfumaryl-CoA isomerase